MPARQTLFEFLERSGAEVSVYDVGRRIGRFHPDRFVAFEEAREPYPLPMQRKAWCAFVQVTVGSREPVIWFLRLDLDEQGFLVQAARDELLNRLLESAQADVGGGDAQRFLQENPAAFTPETTRMAQFHAQLSVDLGLSPSRFHAHARAYFSGEPGWSQWEFVGYQGIADVACRRTDTSLADAIAPLPDRPLLALCHCLDNQRPDEGLRDALLDRLDREMAVEDPAVARIAALVRSLAGATESTEVKARLLRLLDHPVARDIELLAAISGRAWEALHHRALLDRFLDRLADNSHGQAAFEACLDDLLSLPDLRDTVRAALRDPAQPVHLRAAFGRMLQRAQ